MLFGYVLLQERNFDFVTSMAKFYFLIVNFKKNDPSAFHFNTITTILTITVYLVIIVSLSAASLL